MLPRRARTTRRRRATPTTTPDSESNRQADTAGREGRPLLAFVQIPRTGAGAFSSALARNYSPRPGIFQQDPEATRKALALIGSEGIRNSIDGQVPYGLYLKHLPASTRYVTVLRDPVDRVLAHYHFDARTGNPRGSTGERALRRTWEQLLNTERLEREGGEQEAEIVLEPDADVSLEEGLRRKIPIYDNFMTRFLWGGESLFGGLPPDAVERAKENISQFWFVGIRERLDDSIVLLGRKLGVGLMPYNRRPVSETRLPPDDVPAELRELVAEHNAMDVELYRFAREQFDATAPTPEELAKEVEELGQLSVAATAVSVARKAAQRDEKAAIKTERKAAAKERKVSNKAGRQAAEKERAAAKSERRAAEKERKAATKSGREAAAKERVARKSERKAAKNAAHEQRAARRAEVREERAANRTKKPRTDRSTPTAPESEESGDQGE